MTTQNFNALGIIEPIARALAENNYAHPTPIQRSAIPPLLQGKDLLGIAQTGTGKTAAFALPMLQQLSQAQGSLTPRSVRALVLAPTRELAIQIADNCQAYGRNLSLRQCVIFGGVSQNPQVHYLSRGTDLLIATPGRLVDLMQQGHVKLDKLTHLVLDEADRMLDMGFIRDIKKIIAAIPKARQTMLFSATMPASIASLAQNILNHPVRVEVTPQVVTVERIEQSLYSVRKSEKPALLITLLQDASLGKVIVFGKTKHGANRILTKLESAGIPSAVIHGNKSQGARQNALEAFRSGAIRVLVATDIVARGIDVDNITHVINYELPNEPESYVHRIGRTARAGTSGIAIAFCDETEGRLLKDIEKLTKHPLARRALPELVKLPEQSKPTREHQERKFRNSAPKRKFLGPKHNSNGNGRQHQQEHGIRKFLGEAC